MKIYINITICEYEDDCYAQCALHMQISLVFDMHVSNSLNATQRQQSQASAVACWNEEKCNYQRNRSNVRNID